MWEPIELWRAGPIWDLCLIKHDTLNVLWLAASTNMRVLWHFASEGLKTRCMPFVFMAMSSQQWGNYIVICLLFSVCAHVFEYNQTAATVLWFQLYLYIIWQLRDINLESWKGRKSFCFTHSFVFMSTECPVVFIGCICGPLAECGMACSSSVGFNAEDTKTARLEQG